MAVIPIRPPRGRFDNLPNVRMEQHNPEAYGALEGRAMGDLAKGISSAGNAIEDWGNVMARAAHDKNIERSNTDTRTWEVFHHGGVWPEGHPEAGQRFEGILNQEGEYALDVVAQSTAFSESLIRDRIEKDGLEGDALEKYKARMAPVFDRTWQQASAYQSRQSEMYHNQVMSDAAATQLQSNRIDFITGYRNLMADREFALQQLAQVPDPTIIFHKSDGTTEEAPDPQYRSRETDKINTLSGDAWERLVLQYDNGLSDAKGPVVAHLLTKGAPESSIHARMKEIEREEATGLITDALMNEDFELATRILDDAERFKLEEHDALPLRKKVEHLEKQVFERNQRLAAAEIQKAITTFDTDVWSADLWSGEFANHDEMYYRKALDDIPALVARPDLKNQFMQVVSERFAMLEKERMLASTFEQGTPDASGYQDANGNWVDASRFRSEPDPRVSAFLANELAWETNPANYWGTVEGLRATGWLTASQWDACLLAKDSLSDKAVQEAVAAVFADERIGKLLYLSPEQINKEFGKKLLLGEIDTRRFTSAPGPFGGTAQYTSTGSLTRIKEDPVQVAEALKLIAGFSKQGYNTQEMVKRLHLHLMAGKNIETAKTMLFTREAMAKVGSYRDAKAQTIGALKEGSFFPWQTPVENRESVAGNPEGGGK